MQSQVGLLGNVYVTPNGEAFFADRGNHRVRKILTTGRIVTIAGTGQPGYNGDHIPATEAQLNEPAFVIVSDREVYISEYGGNRIRKILSNGQIVTVAGTGERGYNGDGIQAIDAKLCFPFGLDLNENGELFIADYGNGLIRKVSSSGVISIVAGAHTNSKNIFTNTMDGISAKMAHLNKPSSVCIYNNEIYISEHIGHRVRKVDRNGLIFTVVGTGVSGYSGDGGLATEAQLSNPWFASAYNDELYISDFSNNVIRRVTKSGTIFTICGNGESGDNGDGGLATNARIGSSTGVFVTSNNDIYLADYSLYRIIKIDSNGIISTIAGNGNSGYSGDVPFDFQKYPHIGPKKKQLIKPFPKAYHDISIGSELW